MTSVTQKVGPLCVSANMMLSKAVKAMLTSAHVTAPNRSIAGPKHNTTKIPLSKSPTPRAMVNVEMETFNEVRTSSMMSAGT